MAERTVVVPAKCIPLPSGLDPAQAAAIVNPGMSAWLSLKLRAGVAAGETVLIMGATGVAGQLAIQSALPGCRKNHRRRPKPRSARIPRVDAVVVLSDPEEQVSESFAAQIRDRGIDVVIDYLWGARQNSC
ncbi:MDR/zinc-dependent alcohol dehydrogenase-like family protein [Acidicapsa acidisoli]|uniref:hypothetical protein n=1 Tax=Acidicapsa acidisoli TaxID=1615681 RepID=UPI0021E0F520|nr:hypothetical protein [Acidicapsa acidisoli]